MRNKPNDRIKQKFRKRRKIKTQKNVGNQGRKKARGGFLFDFPPWVVTTFYKSHSKIWE